MAPHLWIVYALSASMLWGVAYVVAEKIMKETAVTPIFLMVATYAITIPIFTGIGLHLGHFKAGINALMTSQSLLWLIALHAVTIVAGNILILTSVLEKNATLATMIEITYPLFVALFAYLILKETQLNWGTACGSALIFAGIFVIFLKG